jgi:hypothetical protein
MIVLRRKLRGRGRLTNHDRFFFVQLYRWFPSILTVITIVQPETLVRWHRAGFRCYWRWISRRRGGRPQIEADLRALIRQMSTENLLWGAPRIRSLWASGGSDFLIDAHFSKFLRPFEQPALSAGHFLSWSVGVQ